MQPVLHLFCHGNDTCGSYLGSGSAVRAKTFFICSVLGFARPGFIPHFSGCGRGHQADAMYPSERPVSGSHVSRVSLLVHVVGRRLTQSAELKVFLAEITSRVTEAFKAQTATTGVCRLHGLTPSRAGSLVHGRQASGVLTAAHCASSCVSRRGSVPYSHFLLTAQQGSTPLRPYSMSGWCAVWDVVRRSTHFPSASHVSRPGPFNSMGGHH
jgi:hypothetical protein